QGKGPDPDPDTERAQRRKTREEKTLQEDTEPQWGSHQKSPVQIEEYPRSQSETRAPTTPGEVGLISSSLGNRLPTPPAPTDQSETTLSNLERLEPENNSRSTSRDSSRSSSENSSRSSSKSDNRATPIASSHSNQITPKGMSTQNRPATGSQPQRGQPDARTPQNNQGLLTRPVGSLVSNLSKTEINNASAVLLQLMDKVPTFSGQPTEDFTEWIKRAALIAKAAGVKAGIMAQILPSRLTERAEQCYLALKPKRDEGGRERFRTLEEFNADMEAALKIPNTRATRMMECQRRKKEEHESILEYAIAIEKLTRKANEDLSAAQLNTRILDAFTNGLPQPMKEQIIRGNFRTIGEAIAAAIVEEQIQKQQREENIFSINRNVNDLTDKEVQEVVNHIGNLKLSPQKASGDFRIPKEENDQRGSQDRRGRWKNKRGDDWKRNNRKRENQGRNKQNNRNGNNQNLNAQNPNYQNPNFQNPNVQYSNFQNPNYQVPNNQHQEFECNNCRGIFPNPYRQGFNFAVVMTMITLISILPVAQTYQICNAQAVPTYIQIPKPMDCELAEREATHEALITLFVPKATPIKVNATRCRKVIKESCVTSMFYYQTSGTFTKTTFEAVGRQECLMKMEKYIEEPWSIQDPETSTDLFGTKCNKTEQIEVTSGTVAYNSQGQMMSTLGTLRGCSPSQGICKAENRTILWSTEETNETCWIQKKGTFKAFWSQPSSGRPEEITILVPELTVAFQPASEPPSGKEIDCMGKNLVRLNYGSFALFEEGDTPANYSESEITRKKRKTRLPSDPDNSGIILAIKVDDPKQEEVHLTSTSPESTTMKAAEEEKTTTVPLILTTVPTLKTSSTSKPPPKMRTPVVQRSTTTTRQSMTESGPQKEIPSESVTVTPRLNNPPQKLATRNTGRKEVGTIYALPPQRETRGQNPEEKKWSAEVNENAFDKDDPWGRTHKVNPENDRDSSVAEINLRIQYLERKLQTAIDDAFDEAFINICNTENEMRQTAAQIAQLRPTSAARLLLGRTDIAAVFAGTNILAITQCTEVNPEKTFVEKKVNESCYLQTPIIVNGELWFAADGSQDLSRNGKQIDCKNVHSSVIYEEGGEWTDGVHKIHVFQVDSNMLHRKHGELILFNTPEIFEKDSQATIPDPSEPLSNIEARLDKLEIVAVGSIASDMVEGARSATMKVAGAANQLMEKLDEVGINPLRKIHQIISSISMVAMIIPIIFTIVLIWYCYPWLAPICRWREKKRKWRRKETNKTEEIQVVQVRNPEVDSLLEGYAFLANIMVMNTGQARKLPYVKVKVGNRLFQALVDTGATASIIRTKEAMDLITQNHATVISDTEKEGSAANNTRIQFKSTIRTRAFLGDKAVDSELTLLVTDELPTPILLGIDTWRKMKASIDLEKNKIQTQKGTIQIHSITAEEAKPLIKAFLPFGATLQPGDNFITARTTNLSQDKKYITEKAESFRNQDLDFCETIFHGSQQDSIPIRIVNRTQEPVEIHPMTNVVQIEEAEIKEDSQNVTQINHITVGPTEYLSPEADVTDKLPGKKEPTTGSKFQYICERIKWNEVQLSKENKKRLKQIIANNVEAFVGPDKIPGEFKGPIQHKIELIDPTLITRQAPYKIAYNLRDELKAILDNLLETRIIRPTTSPFQAPIIMVKKNNGTYRLAIDYRRLNKNIKPAASPVASIEDILNSVGNRKIFTVLDLQNAYHSIHVSEEDAEKLAFSTPFGSFTYNRSPFGLSTSPAVFQQALAFALRNVKASVYHYVDDIIIASSTEEEHLKDIDETLAALKQHGLKAAAEKAQFAQMSVTYLGLKIENGT
ncbi:hypothetical protein FO519_009503, partial [Halicephalobus sp. NKZ332]